MSDLLRVEQLTHAYRLAPARLFAKPRALQVLHGIDIALKPGGSLGVVGESGCGKSTLARAVLALERPSGGKILLHGQDLFAAAPKQLRALRRHIQPVFQDPNGSLDPRQTIARIIAEPIAALEPHVTRTECHARVAEGLAAVGLPESAGVKYPHQFSGGQRQRIAIARALVTRPDLIVADEAVSALDVSVQAQVLNLMMDLRQQRGLAYLFISHDLGVVRWISEQVVVMYLGRVVEQGPTAAVFDAPAHPYTRALIAAIPGQGRGRSKLAEAPAAARGCAFAPRCPSVAPACAEPPPLRDLGAGRACACHFA